MSKMTEQKQLGFFAKYKKWIIGAFGVIYLPRLIFAFMMIVGIGYSVITNFIDSSAFHSKYTLYKPLKAGFDEGEQDGAKDKRFANNYDSGEYSKSRESLRRNPWFIYDSETDLLKRQALKEKEDYIASFPVEERGAKLAEMKQKNIKLPLQKKLDKRYKHAMYFLMDLAEARIEREKFASDKEYNKALEQEAWKLGYDYGYSVGRVFGFNSSASDKMLIGNTKYRSA